jgi:hypothetical protein
MNVAEQSPSALMSEYSYVYMKTVKQLFMKSDIKLHGP